MEQTYPSSALFDKIAELQAIVETRFVVKETYVDRGIPVFIVSLQPMEEQKPEALKGAFKEVALKIKGQGFFPFLRRENGQLVLRTVQKSAPTPTKPWLTIALLLATCATIFLDGYMRIDNPIWTVELMPQVPAFSQAIFFTISILAVIGLHEFGHKIACMINRVDASMPYFIPGVPGFSPGGTYGAVITLKEPPTNRDELFDLGLNGPLVGFGVTIIVTFIGVFLSPVLPLEELYRFGRLYGVEFAAFPSPLLLEIVRIILGKIPSGNYTVLLHPIGFAAWVGAVVTFLNLMPIAVLDGGHISMALFGPKGHRITSIIGLVILLVTGFWPMALLVLFFMFGRPYGVPLLDEVSPLGNSRKLVALLVPVIISLCVVFVL